MDRRSIAQEVFRTIAKCTEGFRFPEWSSVWSLVEALYPVDKDRHFDSDDHLTLLQMSAQQRQQFIANKKPSEADLVAFDESSIPRIIHEGIDIAELAKYICKDMKSLARTRRNARERARMFAEVERGIVPDTNRRGKNARVLKKRDDPEVERDVNGNVLTITSKRLSPSLRNLNGLDNRWTFKVTNWNVCQKCDLPLTLCCWCCFHIYNR